MNERFRRLPLLAAIAVASLITVNAVRAHHSTAFYSNETLELQGELVDIQWQNPHIKFALKTVSAAGVETVWHLEASSIFLRQQDGVTRDLFRVGDAVKVAGRRSQRDATALLATNMLLPDGREAPLWPEVRARFVPPDRLIKGSRGRTIDTAQEKRGIFRAWLPPLPASLASLPYTNTAISARGNFDLVAFARRCEPEGMPRIMHTNAFPREFIDRGNEIVLRTDLFDTERTIHMDRSSPPAAEPASRLGYSVGTWEGGQLVVRTTLVNWPYFDGIGTPQSDKVAITERYSLSGDQGTLDLEMTVVDASTFTAPAVIKSRWLPFAGGIQRYDCKPER